MSSDDIKQPLGEEVLRSAESSLDAQINLCIGTAKTAFEHVQRWPNIGALAAVDRAIDLLQSFLDEAECLKDCGRPAAYARLTAILNDVTAARATWAQTMGVHVAADRLDRDKLLKHKKDMIATQRKWIDERNAKAKAQAEEIRKLF